MISGGEDRTVRIWRAADGECQQTIVVPAVSGQSLPLFQRSTLTSSNSSLVWTVKCLENGDIAAGSSDGLVRVFTRKEERVADLAILTVSSLLSYATRSSLIFSMMQSYDDQVSKTALNS